MKTAAIPAVRVPPELRQAAEEVLTDGESLSAFVEESVRRNVEFSTGASRVRRTRPGVARCARASGRYVRAAGVLGKLERRVKAARKKLAGAK